MNILVAMVNDYVNGSGVRRGYKTCSIGIDGGVYPIVYRCDQCIDLRAPYC
jgi:hypothetical protein